MENRSEEKIERIFVEKNESVAEVLEKILSAKDNDIVLVVPKDSILKKSPANFHLIKHEAETSGKKFLIESVDSDILSMAKSFQLEAIHPLLDRHPVSDIKEEFFAEKPEDENKGFKRHLKIKKHFKLPKFSFSKKFLIYAFVIIIVLAGGFFLLNRYLPRATITLALTKHSWSYQEILSGSTSATLTSSTLPIQIFESKPGSVDNFFPASKDQKVSLAASGIITVYNDYSYAVQPLVRGTRFETSDGKIFKTKYDIVVPGAQKINGKFTPSSVDVGVIAAQAGASYNIGPVAKFTIPGFKGMPQYNGFYGSSSGSMSGGFIGDEKVPTQNDINLAKASTTNNLNSSLNLQSSMSGIPSGFKVLPGASTTTLTNLIISTSTNSSGEFSVFAEGAYKVMAFKESDINNLLQASWQQNNPNTIAQNLNISYQNVQADFKNNKLSFSLTATADLVSNISANDIKNKILGKSEQELKSIIVGLPGVEKADVSLWPFWVTSVPSQPSQVEVNLN